MKKHFFTFRKLVDGKPVAPALYIEVIVEVPRSTSRVIARRIAEEEMAEWRDGCRLVRDRIAEERAEHFPMVDYRFVGAN